MNTETLSLPVDEHGVELQLPELHCGGYAHVNPTYGELILGKQIIKVQPKRYRTIDDKDEEAEREAIELLDSVPVGTEYNYSFPVKWNSEDPDYVTMTYVKQPTGRWKEV